ncbi:MAG: DnaJ C-terminal domain-containing protein [Pseudomonadota bacterium]
MSVDFKDYYKVLGVDKKASSAEIKKAFRKLARKHHPDVAQDKSKANDLFSEINEANEVLGDPDKRRKYDELGANWNNPERQAPQQEGGFSGQPGDSSSFHYDGTGFSDFFEQFLGSRGRSSSGFSHFNRAGQQGMGGVNTPQRGQDIESEILVTLNEALHGSTRKLRLQRSEQQPEQTLQVKIPPGVREGQLIRLSGKGQEGFAGGDSGNLYLRVVLAKHPDFRVRGADLYFDLQLSPWEAVLGTTIHLATLDKAVSLKIPPATMAERQFRLRGKGLPSGAGTRGDLYATVSIHVPTLLSPEEKALWDSLAATSTFNPRTIHD